MRFRSALLLFAFLPGQALLEVAHAQPAPFDMSPERPAAPAPAPQLPRPSRVEPRPEAAPEAPVATPPTDATTPEASPASRPAPPLRPEQARTAEAPPASLPPGHRRYIIPSQSIALTGEYSRSAWSVYLTAEQAEAGRSIVLAYQNAIVVAPEASRFTLSINNRQIGEERINAPSGAKSVRWVIPPGLLRPGKNDLELVANQRHRTDCDIRSTYDLWTEVDSGGAFMEFAPSLRPGNSAAEAILALGPDPEGRTHFQMLVPSIGPMEALSPLLRLSQGLAVMSNMPNPQFTFQQQMPARSGEPGRLTIAVGTAAELKEALPNLPAGAETGPVSALVQMPDGQGQMMVITGPTWSAISGAIDSFIAPVLRPSAIRRESMSTDRWTRLNPPFVFGGERLSFAQLGVQTAEFSGQRFRTGFEIAVPSDFYAGAYGEAVLFLDAAYGASVAGGSHIDVYVNGNIASTVPVTEEGGGILRQAPITVTMRHLRAGINHIELEAVLLSNADAACTPGSSDGSDQARFALFDSSVLHVPAYARIGQTPNLAALSGTGFPYSRQQQPSAFFMDRIDADMLSAAANFLGKAAQVSGAPIDLDPVSAANAVGARNAIYIGTASQLPLNVLTQLNLAPDLAAGWVPSDGAEQTTGDNAATLEAWRSRLQGGFLSQRLSDFRGWLQAKLDLSEGALRFLPSAETMFRPGEDDDLLLAQGPGPNGGGIWTVLTAPSPQELKLASMELAQQAVWQQVEGRIFSYSRATNAVAITEARKLSFLPLVDTTPGNYRLIAANWLSSNVLSYALAIVLVSCLLGVTTASLLRWVGRR